MPLAPLLRGLAVALLALAAVPAQAQNPLAACQNGSGDQGIRDCTRVIDRNLAPTPTDLAYAHYNRGNGYANKGDYRAAIADYTATIQLLPGYVNAYFNRGNSYSALGEIDPAIADYSEVLRLAPDYTFAYFNRGNQYYARALFKEALADFSAAIERQPDYWQAYLNRGNTYNELGVYDLAIADFDTVLKLQPGEPQATSGRGIAARAMIDTPPAGAPAIRPPQVAAAEPVRGDQPAIDAGEVRIALVIANADYGAMGDLANPANDAKMVAAALQAVGFDVTVAGDLGRLAFLDALNAFADKVDSADWALIYYAGHGMELGGENYLIPVDAALRTDRTVGDEAIPLDRVLAAVHGARRMRMVILDACRDNPFIPQMRMTNASRAVSRGLALVEPDVGTLVAFAARAGQVAQDGAGAANSPFAAALAAQMGEPGIEIGMFFRRVRDFVLAATGRQQEPFVYGSLPGEDFFFRPPS